MSYLHREIIDKLEEAYQDQNKNHKDRLKVFEEIIIQRVIKLHDSVKTQKNKLKSLQEELTVLKKSSNLKKHETD